MIIGISGKARSGKDTFADMLLKEFRNKGLGYHALAYADDLKRRVMEDFHLTSEQVYGDLKEVPDERYPKKESGFWTPREILQYMGTEGYRAVEPAFWVRQLFERIEQDGLNNVIITDCRFPDEVQAISDRGGIHINITRNDKDYIADTTHASETALDGDDNNVDFYVENNGPLYELEEAASVVAEWVINNSDLKNEIGGV